MNAYKKTKILSIPFLASKPFYKWLVWLLGALFMFYKYALEVSPSVMTNELMGSFHVSGAALGNLAACYFYAYFIMQIPAGLLLDKFGPRIVTTLAFLLCALGSYLFAISEEVLIACIGRFLTGLGAAFAAVNCLKLIANWFSIRQFAFMAGLMMTVGMLGAVAGQAPLASFIESLEWRTAMKIISAIGMIIAIVFWIIVRDRAPGHTKERDLTSDKISLWDSCKHVLKKKQAWWLSIYSGFAFAPISVFGGLWGVSFIQESYQLSHNGAAQAVSLSFIGYAIGAPLLGWFSDYIKRRVVVMFWSTLSALVFLSVIIYAPEISSTLLNLLLLFFGFGISGFMLCFTMIREISMISAAATAIGFMNAFDSIFGAFSDPLTGKLLDLSWDGKMVDGARAFSAENYQMALLVLPIYLIVALITLGFIKETRCKQAYPSSMP